MPIHVFPVNDKIEHDLTGTDCVCGPDVEYVDPRDGGSYPEGPVITHHSLDGRELSE